MLKGGRGERLYVSSSPPWVWVERKEERADAMGYDERRLSGKTVRRQMHRLFQSYHRNSEPLIVCRAKFDAGVLERKGASDDKADLPACRARAGADVLDKSGEFVLVCEW